jgi:hypothetical protein
MIAQNYVVVLAIGVDHIFYAADNIREEGVAEVGDHEPDGARLTAAQAARDAITPIPQAVDGIEHPLPRRGSNKP